MISQEDMKAFLWMIAGFAFLAGVFMVGLLWLITALI